MSATRPLEKTPHRSLHPGIALRKRFLEPLGIEAEELARALGAPHERIAALVAGEAALDVDTALRLGLFFDVPARWWLEMQARYDADDPGRLAALRSVVAPYPGLGDVLVTPGGIRRLDAAREPSGPIRVPVPEALLGRLRTRAERPLPRSEREPEVIELDDGTPVLTGR